MANIEKQLKRSGFPVTLTWGGDSIMTAGSATVVSTYGVKLRTQTAVVNDAVTAQLVLLVPHTQTNLVGAALTAFGQT